MLTWMLFDPFLHSPDFIKAFFTEFPAIDLFLGAARFFAADLGLPRRGKDAVNIVVKLASFERLPFVFVEPHAATIATLIEREVEAATDFVPDQNPVAFGTE